MSKSATRIGRSMRTCLLLLPLATLLAGENKPPPPVVTERNVFTFYRDFPRLTKEPRTVSQALALLCASPSPDMIARETARAGPHAQATIHLYVNDSGQNAIARKAAVFPEGGIVIKEKLGSKDEPVTAVGGMIKRAPGFDPEHGDWEYFYAAKAGGLTIGRLQNCIECHSRAKATDYIYSVWKENAS